MFRPVPPEADFAALETEESARWREHRVFERSVELRAGAEAWVFYEGPPTANGRPGIHHVWARVYKDLFCRYRTMRGYAVPRKAGWDTHGLPVEVEVEKQLGITDKRQIEEQVGIAEFTRLCRESVRNYVDDWRILTERIGYWIDSDAAYWTFSPPYVESVWWNLKNLWDQGLLYEDIKVVPYCPRCGTALSSHELGQPDVYRDIVDESAYVLFPLVDPGDAPDRLLAALGRETLSGLSLVVWTTTPWTLLSNTGAAVGPDLEYGVVGDLIVAADLVEEVLGPDAVVERRVSGHDLIGLHYDRPFDDLVPAPGPAAGDGWRVVAGDFVEADEGTGVVHLAPAFGEVDREVGRTNGLPTLNPVGPDGRFSNAVSWLAGQAVRDTNATVNDRLEAAGRLLRRLPYEHAYPHCWRCDTALIYWGKPSWYVRTSDRKPELVAQNRTIGWHPEHIREGRMGEWLSNNVDWALSRDRYWGTPLPVWRCGAGHVVCVGSLAELSDLAGRDVSGVDPHRPDIDAVTFRCTSCAGDGDLAEPSTEADGEMRRVEPVIDAWFDSGSMPTAQWGYPLAPGSDDEFVYPADFICEAIDQTRGWFYSLLAVNTLVRGSTPYRNVLCLGHLVDADGRKMSKSVGNVIDPWEILDTRGADPLRWWMFSQGSPWTPTRVSLGAIDAAMRDTLLTLWNTWSFFTTYASLNAFDPADPSIPPPGQRSDLDRWMRSRLHATVAATTDRPRRLRAVRGGDCHRRAHRRRLELVRPSKPAPLLAHRSRCRPGGFTRRPGHAARGAGDRGPSARSDVSVRRRPDLARSDRSRGGRFRASRRLAGGGPGLARSCARGGDGACPPSLLPGTGGTIGGGDQSATNPGPGPGLPAAGERHPAGRGGRGRAQRRCGRAHRRAGRRPHLRAGSQLQAPRAPARRPGPGAAGGDELGRRAGGGRRPGRGQDGGGGPRRRTRRVGW